jgi:ADP-ribose pyrophosphatase
MANQKLAAKTKHWSIWDKNGLEYAQLNSATQSVMIAPIHKSGKITLIEKYFPAMGYSALTFPGGKLEPGQNLKQTIIRELEEETGLTANKLEVVSKVDILPAYLVGTTHFAIAKNLTKTNNELDKEVSALHNLKYNQIMQMIKDGKIKDARTIALAHMLVTYAPHLLE